ncbi:MAG: UDP-N-acetylglucosamine 2-epimerase (hydrolyzing), partial [Gammaproteobacteria bacterium]|nr:UDP-N-acetylglucosamine 2-epimerase (hydrolyzing) [Gammaproteobacteria bacterium]
RFELFLYVTGMHMLTKYGSTFLEVFRDGYKNIYTGVNQNSQDTMDVILSKTIAGFSDFVKEVRPDLIVIHGDRVEALAGATVGSLNNILVAHVEGGEVSGTVDELLRHATTKLSHLHFVSNEQARRRLLQMGEPSPSIFVIGSPELDIMTGPHLPSFHTVAAHYEIDYLPQEYAVAVFHPVTTEIDTMAEHAKAFVEALIESGKNYVVIHPNNDAGGELILQSYAALQGNPHFLLYPSMRFEYFLSLMKHAQFMIGNSSAGVREMPVYGLPSINIGTRQHNRSPAKTIIHCGYEKSDILKAIHKATQQNTLQKNTLFGDGKSGQRFLEILNQPKVWETPRQKYFVDQQIFSLLETPHFAESV